MSNNITFRSRHYLPQVVVATAFVAVLPVLVVWVLLADGVISSPWVCIGLAVALSFAASFLGSAYWKRRSGPGDVLFSEILLWGWLRRLRNERRLAKAIALFGLTGTEPVISESVEQRAETLRQMAAALDAQDPYTDGHSRRVALHAAMIARRMGMSREDVTKIQTAAAVHDVGKLRVPIEVLNKPGVLTSAEFELVKQHVDEGAEIVSALEDPELTEMVRHHHERFDGTGYPTGLAGEQSPIGSRVIAVADTFDALTSERPYRAAVPHKQAMEIILAASGTQLDPVAVRAFLKCYSGKRAILFWTLLAVSPQRALAFLGGKNAARANFGSAAVVTLPAALAAVVAAAYGTAGTLSHPPRPVRFAQRSPVVSATSRERKAASPRHTASAGDRVAPYTSSTRAKQATLGVTVSRAGTGASGGHGRGGASGGTSGSSGSSAPGRRGSGATGGAGSGGHGGGPSHTGTGGKSPTGAPAHGGKPTSGGKGNGAAGGSTPSPPPPPASGGSSSSGSSGGSQGPTGSGGGNGDGGSNGGGGGNGNGGGNGQGGGSGEGGGNGQGGGNGGGSGGGSEPQSKQDCMDGGWVQLHFSNQGLCIAFVEHHLHLSLSITDGADQSTAPADVLRLGIGL